MPLPKPNKGEKGDDFIDRCMSNPTMLEEYPDAAQRAAVCRAQVDTRKASYERTRLDERRRKRRRKIDDALSYRLEVEKGVPWLPLDMNDLREFRAARRISRRRERLGIYPTYSCEVACADISQSDIAGAGKLTDDQDSRFKRKGSDALRFIGLGKAEGKTEGGKTFPRSAYALNTGSPSEWKLRLYATPADASSGKPDVRLTAAAAQALSSSGFRGNRVQLPEGSREKVVSRVRAAWLKARRQQGKEVSREDLPPVLKSEEKVPDAGMIVPAELTADSELARRKAQDALRALFAADLAKIDDAARTFTETELVNLAKGGSVDPEAVRELYRVAKTVSLMVNVPHPLAKAEDPDEPAPVELRKFDDELQIVWGEVYVPMIPDTDGDVMTAEEIRKAAYNFAARMRLDQIDQMHDQDACGAYVVESFIARKGDPVFIEDSWVIGVHIPNKEIWKKVKDGTYNGFSLEGKAMRVEKQFEMEIPDQLTGRTSVENGHSHDFTARFSDQGEFLGGWTSEDYDNSGADSDWHRHQISRGTVVDPGGANSHRHRYSISEAILEVSTGRRPPKGSEISQAGYTTEG